MAGMVVVALWPVGCGGDTNTDTDDGTRAEGTGGSTGGEAGTFATGSAAGERNGPDCPSTRPVQDDCELGLSCTYGQDTCYCVTSDSGTGIWGCGGCPVELPEDGAPCTAFMGASCAYADVDCVCPFTSPRAWSCNKAEIRCPLDPPADGDACAVILERCSYTAATCLCAVDMAWTCTFP